MKEWFVWLNDGSSLKINADYIEVNGTYVTFHVMKAKRVVAVIESPMYVYEVNTSKD